jgi:DNA-directed RNA polymerase subunit RPC12/RpoP
MDKGRLPALGKRGREMNRYKCPACGGNQYTSCSTAQGCIYCGHKELKKMNKLEPEESEGEEG